MRRCTTLAVVLSLSACEHAGFAAEPTTPDRVAPATPEPAPAPPPPPPPRPAISAQPEAERPQPLLPKVPCRARVCPEWKTEVQPKLVAEPKATEERAAPVEEPRSYGVSRAYRPWRDEKPKIRIQKLPATTEAPK